MRKILLFIFFFAGITIIVNSQSLDKPVYSPYTKGIEDSILHINIKPISVFPHKSYREHFGHKYWRLVKKVKKVYPYAKKASELLESYDSLYTSTQDRKLRKKYIKQIEKKLFIKYGPELKKLSFTEGRILIKLIDRQTGRTSYELIRNFNGGFSAFMWQGVARLFGDNLKSEYNPEEEDKLIERIIFFIDLGIY